MHVDAEISDLKSTGVYCAGFTDESIRAREDLYDIFVDGELIVDQCCILFILQLMKGVFP